MLENKSKTGLIRELKERFPGCMVVHLDPNEIQGIPDLLVLYGTTWGALEGKKSASAPHRPNQDYYVQQMDEICYDRLFAVWRAYGGMWVYLRDLRMITIVLDGRYLVIAGAILNLIGLFAVFMTDSGYIENDIYHYILYLLIVAATMLVIVGISIMW